MSGFPAVLDTLRYDTNGIFLGLAPTGRLRRVDSSAGVVSFGQGSWSHLGPCWGYVGPSWSFVGTTPAHVRSMLALCLPILGLCLPILGACWAMLGAMLGPRVLPR